MKTEKMIELGLMPRQLLILERLQKGEQTAMELRCKLLSPVSISSHVEALVQRGYVNRRPCQNDRRCVYISLTEAGKALIQD